MTENSALMMRLMAAASVLGLSLGMGAANAEQIKGETVQGGSTTQIKGETDQHKLTTGFLKHNTVQQDHKLSTGFLKQNDHKTSTGSNQLKWDAVSGQQKHDIPSSEFNPQPEPPKPTGGSSPQTH